MLYYNSIFHLFGQSAGSLAACRGGRPSCLRPSIATVCRTSSPQARACRRRSPRRRRRSSDGRKWLWASGTGRSRGPHLGRHDDLEPYRRPNRLQHHPLWFHRDGDDGLAHNLVTGAEITMSGATQTEYNVTAIVTVTGSTTFTYTVAGTRSRQPPIPVYTVTNFPIWRHRVRWGRHPGQGPSASRLPGGRDLQHDRQPVHLQRQGDGRKVGNGSAAAQTYRVYIGTSSARPQPSRPSAITP